MNRLQKELGPQGLIVVGVTNEPESLVTKDVEKSKMHHPILMISGEDTDAIYGIKGFPSGFVLDPDGNIIWSGHPGNLDEDWLKEQLAKAVAPPVLPDQWKDIGALLAKRKYGKAHAAATKALVKAAGNADLKAVVDFVTKGVQSRLEAAKTNITGQEFGKAMKLYTEVSTLFDGAPGADAAKAGIDALKKDKAATDELAAWARLQDAVLQWRKGELDKALKAFAAVARKWPDTPSGKRAAELASSHS
jgi:hypothetical protein